MMDHAHDHGSVDGPWAGGWLVAVLAGLIAAALSRWLGDVGTTAAALTGAMVFGVYGVLLGSGGVELSVSQDHGDGHDHGHH
jgi:high-affinity Fe2+/Pb2+ permease